MEKRGKIKVLYTIPNFDTAGSGKVVYDLVKGLDKDKFEVEIACRHNRGFFFTEVESLKIPIHILETTCSYRPYYSLYFRLRPIIKFFKKNKYDIIHSWDWSSDWTEVLAARLAGVKWLYTKKAMSWGNKHWKLRSFLSNYIITINNEMVHFFSTKRNQALIPLGINTDYYNPALFSTSTIQNPNYNIITVANLVPVKGIEILIKAIKELDDTEIKLIVLGDHTNEYGRQLMSLCSQLKISNQVSFFGKQLDVRSFIKNSDLYVIPTINKGEGMPMALVEAMSMAIPVLGSDISGINFVLKDFKHLLFEAGNEKELSKKILEIKSLPATERIKLGNILREYVIKNFNYMNFITEHQVLYNKLKN